MHDNGVTLQKKVLQNLDIPYSYELAKRMEQYRSHPTLGYRPAGSKAEFETGEMLKTEMEKIGLSEVTKDAVTVDGWEFHKAALSYTNAVGETVSAELGQEEAAQGLPILVDAVILKNRNGARGHAPLKFMPRFNCYEDADAPF